MVTRRSSLIYTDQLQDAVASCFAGKPALKGTGAATIKYNLPTDAKGGDTIVVPYWDNIGELEDVAEGVALTPVNLTATQEEATVQRSGKAAEITAWAQMTAMHSDPYKELARQIVEGAGRRIDKGLIDVALTTDVIHDKSAVQVNVDMFINAMQLFGDEQDDLACWIMHSQILSSLRKARDDSGAGAGTGGYLLGPPNQNGMPTIWGKPVLVSDRLTAISGTGNSAVYPTLGCKRSSLAAWVNSTPSIDTDKDILTDSDLQALNMYWLAHRYKRTPTSTTTGVVKILSLRTAVS